MSAAAWCPVEILLQRCWPSGLCAQADLQALPITCSLLNSKFWPGAGEDASTAEPISEPEPLQALEGTPLGRLRTAPAGTMSRQRSTSAPVTPLSRLNPQMEALRGPPEAAAAALSALEDSEREADGQQPLELSHEQQEAAGSPWEDRQQQPEAGEHAGSPAAPSQLTHRLRSASGEAAEGSELEGAQTQVT